MYIQVECTKDRPGRPPLQAAFQLNLKHGRITFLAGPPGSGKSTLLDLLLGRLRPDKGFITADGKIWFKGDGNLFVEPLDRPVRAVRDDEILSRHQTAQAILSRALPHWPSPTRARRVAVLLDRIGLGRLANRKVLELDPEQSWKLALARALAPHPRLLLLDEPFAGLDAGPCGRFEADLRQLALEEKVAVLLSDACSGPLARSEDFLLSIAGGQIQRSIPIRFPAGPGNPFVGAGPSQGWRDPLANTS
jgi:ABC-type sulfate/molybdate transport systems ATPase subunit